MWLERRQVNLDNWGIGKFARLQIITIEDLFAGKKPAIPAEDPAAFRKAAREEDQTRQAKLI